MPRMLSFSTVMRLLLTQRPLQPLLSSMKRTKTPLPSSLRRYPNRSATEEYSVRATEAVSAALSRKRTLLSSRKSSTRSTRALTGSEQTTLSPLSVSSNRTTRRMNTTSPIPCSFFLIWASAQRLTSRKIPMLFSAQTTAGVCLCSTTPPGRTLSISCSTAELNFSARTEFLSAAA